MKTEIVRTRVHSDTHKNDVIYHWHRELTGEEAGKLFDEDEELLFERVPGHALNVVLRGETFEEAAANRQIIG